MGMGWRDLALQHCFLPATGCHKVCSPLCAQRYR
uniref:Mha1 n=1 Tax=Arundo donax TaxID=35708 RepID=A0A0A8YTW0_ARUDO